MDAKVPQRRLARELALQVLFQKEFIEISAEAGLAYFRESIKSTEEVWAYAQRILAGIDENATNIDKKISGASAKWSLARMSLVDKNTLRVATWEMFYSDNEVPPKVIINEAIEVVKKYGNTDSPAFVNGILHELSNTL
jgi:transcription antitermination protein NusB